MARRVPPRVRTLRIVLEYDGTRYFGWQVQKGRPTVQGEVERAVREITGRDVTVIGSGRTDAGVHARAQVASFRTTNRIPAAKWPLALNAHLPDDIRVLSAEDAPEGFHAQFDAKRKTYEYVLLNRDVASALDRDRTHLVRRPLDVEAMRRAAALLVGTHDFRAFGSEMSSKERTVRTIFDASVRKEGDRLTFSFTANGFLYNQVRAMVGTLLDVGRGTQPPEWVAGVLEGKDRTKAGVNVPAKGLYLVSVEYGPPGDQRREKP